MHSLLITAAAALLGIAIPAAAGEHTQFGRTAQLYQETSNAGESLDAFIARIAPRALATTFERDVVLCGLIAKTSSGQLSLQLVTSGSPWKCNLRVGALQPGSRWTGLVFRTHTKRAADDWTASDMRHPGYLATERKLTYRNANIWRKLADY